MGHDDIDLSTNAVSGAIVDAACHVHTRLGPVSTSACTKEALAHTLRRRVLEVVRKRPVDIVFDGLALTNASYADLVVEERVLVEVKAVDLVHRVHFAQVQTYLRFSGISVGLPINFHAAVLKGAIQRVVLTP